VTPEIRTDIIFKENSMEFKIGDEVLGKGVAGKILHPAAKGLWQVQWSNGSISTIREVELTKIIKPAPTPAAPKTYNIKKIKKPITGID